MLGKHLAEEGLFTLSKVRMEEQMASCRATLSFA